MDVNWRTVDNNVKPAEELLDVNARAALNAEAVSILGNTLNLGLQELGYFPGMAHALKDTRAELVKLREQNAKLVADNTTLSRITVQQNESIRQLAAGQSATQDNHGPIVQGLQHQIQQLQADRENLLHTQQQYLQENRFMHTELERITAGEWHQSMNLVAPSRLMSSKAPSSNTSAITPISAYHAGPSQANAYDARQHVRKPSYTFVPQISGGGSSRSSHRPQGNPAGTAMHTWKHHNGRTGPPPISATPVIPSSSPGFRPSVLSPSTMRPSSASTYASARSAPSASRRSSITVIDLTDESQPVGATIPSTDDLRALKRRRVEDEGSKPNSSNSSMDMRSMNMEITTLNREITAPVATRPVVGSAILPPLGMHSNHPSPVIPSAPAVVVTAEPEETNVESEDEDEEEDEEMTDIWDEHGLLKLELCLEAAYKEVDGKMICKMCDQKTDGKAPEPMADSSQPALVKHCEEAHPAGWGTLRKGNRKEEKTKDSTEQETPA
ncbi:hypothetical protein BC835DRAFT_394569 [Cytidiella melzeri]|nr:hypothetical protein BC835DRAFT_394569 [Cytidiella melzeri]